MTSQTTSNPDISLVARAQARHVRVTPMKARRMVDLIRGKAAAEAVTTLRFAPQSAADPVRKVLESAIANARFLADRDSQPFDETALRIDEAFVDEGPTMKRFRPRAQGRAGRILKRTSHITVILVQEERKAAPAAKGATKTAPKKTAERKPAKEGTR